MYRVLIVDDEPSVFEGLELLINWKACGFKKPSCAFDYAEALNKLEEDKYHVVITDIKMPGMSGLDLIQEIRKIAPDVKVLILSGYERFSYLKEAMKYGVKDYLLKPVNRHELTNCMKALKNELDREHDEKCLEHEKRINEKKRFLYDLASGNLMEYEINACIAKYDLTFRGADYCIALCSIVNFSRMVSENCDKARKMRTILSKMIEEALIKWKMGDVYDDTDGLIGLVLYQDNGSLDREKIEKCLNEICLLAEKGTEYRVVAGYGNIVGSLENLKDSRNNAILALERRFMEDGHSVIPYDSVLLRENILFGIKWDIQPLINAVICNDAPGAEKSIGELTEELAAKAFPEDVLPNIVRNVLLGLREALKDYGDVSDSLLKQAEINRLFADPISLENLRNWLIQTCAAMQSDVQACISRKRKSNIAQKVKNYIDANLTRNLNIKMISQKFYINPAYLGQLFKKTFGESINDYINRKKIAEVKRMVASGDILVHDAISRMGYRNQGYFYKKFKYYEKTTFAEFNQKLKEARKNANGD